MLALSLPLIAFGYIFVSFARILLTVFLILLFFCLKYLYAGTVVIDLAYYHHDAISDK